MRTFEETESLEGNKNSEVESNSTDSCSPSLALAGRRSPFQNWERKEMINYLCEEESIGRAKGLKVWQELIDEGKLTHRTPFSLQNHFLKKILPNIHHYVKDPRYLEMFENLKR